LAFAMLKLLLPAVDKYCAAVNRIAVLLPNALACVDGRRLLVPCAACRLLPLLSFH
jgi:hypothetical protein